MLSVVFHVSDNQQLSAYNPMAAKHVDAESGVWVLVLLFTKLSLTAG